METTTEPTAPKQTSFNVSIPTTGNAWVLENGKYTSSELIKSNGVTNWIKPNHTIRTFFYLERAGHISLGIRAKVHSGTSRIRCTISGVSHVINLQNSDFTNVYIGEIQVNKPGYYYLELIGLDKEGVVFADVQDVLLGGINVSDVKYIKDDFYFGRRGPSVHLNFVPPNDVDQVEWFYSELMVPENNDVIGSYFMANGFGEGYFGIQVNSPTERRILFSIWSPYQTDNPDDIPEDHKIKLLKKGQDVVTGEFGNEGSGGQSFKVFNWKAGVNYGFLVGAKPLRDGNTDYTAYFHDPTTDEWNLIAQFRRPKTTTYLTRLYSFLENFIPDTGVHERRALYQNQWAYDTTSGWHELTQVTFTADNTARKEYRLDYSGGVEGDGFYLKNCGFTTDVVAIDSRFSRPLQGREPDINFSELE